MSIYSLYMYNHYNLQLCHRTKISVLKSIAIGVVGYEECCLTELQNLMPPFEVTLNHTHVSEKVLQYRGVISKSLQLVHSGEYVELCVPFEVWTQSSNCSRLHIYISFRTSSLGYCSPPASQLVALYFVSYRAFNLASAMLYHFLVTTTVLFLN